VDFLHAYGAADVRRRIDEVRGRVLEMVRAGCAFHVWIRGGSVDELGLLRRASMSRFQDDCA